MDDGVCREDDGFVVDIEAEIPATEERDEILLRWRNVPGLRMAVLGGLVVVISEVEEEPDC